ncbi:helix-turn-helix domain-containing protein [Defluviimonas sp. WL0024]|uniref:Helix-turn-helix domain-containing protein n=1 Tax=Albidovulum salinarum TaxID=2984153 RepID=A0ABT2XF94_9RHOB|nr:helix-turn-helix domain-containing protein [Defluviimonas sp. WL0024]MCU9850345.1 helix-turn-helix domain-containing protein [Defluviimonas sp. WL0024]
MDRVFTNEVREELGPQRPAPAMQPSLRIGILAVPDFTLMSFSCFVEYLRLAADERDFSRKIYCDWSLLSNSTDPIRASCGFEMVPTAGVDTLSSYDYLLVHGGILHSRERTPDYVYQTIDRAVQEKVPLVGLCTGQFVLAEMGLLDGRKCAVHFSQEPAMNKLFPKVETDTESPVVEDRGVITCPGGLAAISLATRLVSEHCGTARAEKVMHYFMADRHESNFRKYSDVQSLSGGYCQDKRVLNAIAIMRQQMYERNDIADIADQVGSSKRGLTRLFHLHFDKAPMEYWRDIRLSAAHWQIVNSGRSITEIAYECGFTDSSHLIRWFKKKYGVTPSALRKANVRVGAR